MALVPCRECGKEISTEAAACPHCGAPAPTSSRPAAAGSARAVVRGAWLRPSPPPPASGLDQPKSALTVKPTVRERREPEKPVPAESLLAGDPATSGFWARLLAAVPPSRRGVPLRVVNMVLGAALIAALAAGSFYLVPRRTPVSSESPIMKQIAAEDEVRKKWEPVVRDACREAVTKGLRNSEGVSFKDEYVMLGSDILPLPIPEGSEHRQSRNSGVIGKVKAMNNFGAWLTRNYFCTYYSDGHAVTSVSDDY